MPPFPVISFVRARLSDRARGVLFHPAFAGCLFWALIVGIAWAADCFLVTERYGTVPFGGYGASIVLIGDVNGDGATVSEILVGAPGFPGSTLTSAGSAFVLDGLTFEAIRTHQGDKSSDRFGWVVAALGDQDLDGIPDYGVGSPGWGEGTDEAVPLNVGRTYIFSGAGGAPITILEGLLPGAEFGFSLTPGFEADAQTVALDYAVGAPGDPAGTIDRRGAVYVYLSGSPVPIRLTGEQEGDRFGHSIAVLPVPAPRRALIVVGAPEADSSPPDPTMPDAGAVYVFETDGRLVNVLTGAAPGDRFGAAVAVIADVDTDGQADLAVGSPTAGGVGRVSVHSGGTGQLLYDRFGQVPGQETGFSVSGLGDMTNDGLSDVAFGSPGFALGPQLPFGMAHVVRGGTGMELCQPIGAAPGDRFGHVIAPAGDLNGDGLHEIWVGAPGSSGAGVDSGGVIRLYTVVPGPPPGTVRISAIDGASEGDPLTMEWDYPFGTCAAFDFAVYRQACATPPCDAGTDLAIETCSTGGAPMVTIPLPPILEPGTCYLYYVAPLTNNEESLGLFPLSDAATEAPASPRSHPTVSCRVFLNPAPCRTVP